MLHYDKDKFLFFFCLSKSIQISHLQLHKVTYSILYYKFIANQTAYLSNQLNLQFSRF